MIAEGVYILCTFTSIVCAALLLRAYVRSRARLLLWSCLCFVGLMANNIMLFIDKVVYPDVEMPRLVIGRCVVALVAISMMIFGLIWDTE